MPTADLKLPGSLRELLLSCEAGCVVACCGLTACDFSEARFTAWLKKRAPDQRSAVAAQLESLVGELLGSAEAVVDCRELNMKWPRREAVAFFLGLKPPLRRAMVAVQGGESALP